MKVTKSIFLFFAFAFFWNIPAKAQITDEQECYSALSQLSIPLVIVDCKNGKEPLGEIVFGPEDPPPAHTKIRGEKVECSIKVIISGTTVYESGEYKKDESGATIKLRGNSTAFLDPKPYKIKLQKKANMLFYGDNSYYKDKDWVLIKMADKDLRTQIGFKVSELIGQDYVPAYRIVNLIINGTYRGLYTLCESIKISKTHRINLDNDGYIIECDPYYFAEPVWFKTGAYLPWTFKDPDGEDVSEAYVEQVRQDVIEMENSIKNGTYEEKIDLESYVRWLYGHDLLGTWDYGGSNMFVTRKNPSAKFCMGPLWDFDTIMILQEEFNAHHGANVIMYPYFFFIENKTFLIRWIDRIEEDTDGIVSELLDWLDEKAETQEYKDLDVARQWDAKRWNYSPVTVEQNIQQAKEYFPKRAAWLKEAALQLAPTSLPEIETNKHGITHPRYNLRGTRATSEDRLFIEQGKKYIRK